MNASIDIARLLRENPQVDAEKLNESLDLAKKLSECGLEKTGPRIVPPSDRHRARVVDSKADRHVVQLKKP